MDRAQVRRHQRFYARDWRNIARVARKRLTDALAC